MANINPWSVQQPLSAGNPIGYSATNYPITSASANVNVTDLGYAWPQQNPYYGDPRFVYEMERKRQEVYQAMQQPLLKPAPTPKKETMVGWLRGEVDRVCKDAFVGLPA